MRCESWGATGCVRVVLLLWVAACGGVCAWGQGVEATSVPLLLPTGVAYDGAGNLYIAEAGNHRVRKVDAQGWMTSLAGNGQQGYGGDGGPATAAQVDTPVCVALDGSGSVYVCDSHNHRVRRVDAVTGVITTVVGTGAAGFAGDGGAATAAMLDLPVAIAVDGTGNLWVADAREHRVRRVDAGTGVIRTVAGTGAEGFSGDGGLSIAAMLDAPSGLALDAGGNLYVADAHNGRVRRIDGATGVITTVAGGGSSVADAGATAVRLRLPRGVAVDAAGRLYISDATDLRVRQVDAANGVAVTVAGSGVEGFSGEMGSPTAATMQRPAGVALSPAGLLTVAEAGDGRVRQVTADPVIRTIAGLGGGTGAAAASAVTVSGAGSAVYGTGSMAVQVATTGVATGTLTLLDGGALVGTAALVGNAGTFAVGTLEVGAHTLSVRYSGDATHAAAVSAGVGLTVTAAPVQVMVDAATQPYGAATPAFSGTVTGLLAQDAGRVSVVYATTVTAGSTVGSYAITASLSGVAAGDYALSVVPGSLTVVKAGSVAVVGSAAVQSDSSVLATVAVRSATTGQPAGVVTLLDGGTPVAAGPVGAAGSVVLNSGSMASGAHSFTAYYAGDGNFLASTSAGLPVTVGGGGGSASPSADFTLSSTGAGTQTVSAGSSVDFGMWAKWTGATMSSPVTLAVSGLPAFATASFNPGFLPPGGAVSAFTMTVGMPATVAGRGSGLRSFGVAVLCGLLPMVVRRRAWRPGLLGLLLAVGAVGMGGCGDRVRSAGQGIGVTTKSYPLTVTGTATDASGAKLQHTVQVTLVVESSGT